MNLFDAKTIEARRERLTLAFEKELPADTAVLFFSGAPIQKPGGLDQTYPFLPHPEYLWLTGSRRANGVIAYARGEGWIDFVEKVTDAERLWEGTIGEFEGRPINELDGWISTKKFTSVLTLGQPPSIGPWRDDAQTKLRVQKCVNAVRRRKDAAEVALIRRCAEMANAGYLRLRELMMPGISERGLQIEYEAAVLRAGAEKFPYETIVGTGSNAAILHANPTGRVLAKDELVLVDAGADVGDYGVDITRTYCTSTIWPHRFGELYDIVLQAQTAGISQCVPGTAWPDVHRTCARVMADGLKSLGILKGSIDAALESGAIAVFFPHGVGHMVGLRVRDVGEDPDRAPSYVYGSRLRVGLSLQEGHLMTVEPGLYFVSALINNADVRAKYQTEINWSEVEKWKHVGGIRIEDDILVTAGSPENLTAVVSKVR